ncbi:unnamed protein product [Brachionus calyciflorus]|uniref:Uncharacterized protein n=1 Tax=Brachionus calyciflorus TaxID=104777 RepID=A0A813RD46_9BILA|nr:unnamed protein product [Brachionus calyciflorus]
MGELKKFYIQEKFKEDIFSFQNLPRIICMENSEVFIFKNSEKTKPQLRSCDCERDFRLKALSYGDWQLHISVIKCEYFQSREVFDNLFLKEMEIYEPESFEYIQDISIQKALDLLNVDFGCDIDYYLSDLSKIRNDLHLDLSDNLIIEKLDIIRDILFYFLMCGIFDERDFYMEECLKSDLNKNQVKYATEASFILNDFRLLHDDGNRKYATARRGQYYLILDYVTD